MSMHKHKTITISFKRKHNMADGFVLVLVHLYIHNNNIIIDLMSAFFPTSYYIHLCYSSVSGTVISSVYRDHTHTLLGDVRSYRTRQVQEPPPPRCKNTLNNR
jgi:hypothetical protein